MFHLLPPPHEDKQVLQSVSVKCHMRDRVRRMDIFILTNAFQGFWEALLECELEIEIQSCLDAASSACRQEERPLKRPSIITCPFSVSFGQGRFCEHEEEDISGEFDVWHIVVEWLFPSPYFYFCSDMPREPCASRKMFTVPLGPKPRHLWYPKPWR